MNKETIIKKLSKQEKKRLLKCTNRVIDPFKKPQKIVYPKIKKASVEQQTQESELDIIEQLLEMDSPSSEMYEYMPRIEEQPRDFRDYERAGAGLRLRYVADDNLNEYQKKFVKKLEKSSIIGMTKEEKKISQTIKELTEIYNRLSLPELDSRYVFSVMNIINDLIGNREIRGKNKRSLYCVVWYYHIRIHYKMNIFSILDKFDLGMESIPNILEWEGVFCEKMKSKSPFNEICKIGSVLLKDSVCGLSKLSEEQIEDYLEFEKRILKSKSGQNILNKYPYNVQKSILLYVYSEQKNLGLKLLKISKNCFASEKIIQKEAKNISKIL